MKEDAAAPRIESVTADGQFSVGVGGFLQARGVAEQAEHGPTVAASLPRTRLYVFGRLASDRLRYRLMVGTNGDQLALRLFDAYLEARLQPTVRLRGGRFKVPVLREWIESARTLASVERALAVQRALPGRALGAQLWWEPGAGPVELSVGAYDRRTEALVRPDVAYGVIAGRVLYNVIGDPIEGELDFEGNPPRLALGASAMATLPDPRAVRSTGQHVVGLDLALQIRRWDFGAEGFATLLSRPEPGARERELGGFVRLDRYVPPLRASFGARATGFARTVRGLDAQGDPGLVTLPPAERALELELDFGYFPLGHELKLLASPFVRLSDRPPRLAGGGIVQLQVVF